LYIVEGASGRATGRLKGNGNFTNYEPEERGNQPQGKKEIMRKNYFTTLFGRGGRE